MSKPFVLVQLTDPHLGASWTDDDPEDKLAAAVAAVREACPRLDAVLVTGDLTEHAADAEYARVRELLAPLGAPVHVLPGNHDDRRGLRRRFGLPGEDDEPVHYAVDLGPLRLVALDSTIPGETPGTFEGEQLAWLDGELAAAPDVPTLIALHHPPVAMGLPAWDALGLAQADRDALEAVVARHPQVRRIVAGHVHRTTVGELAGRPVLALGSTYAQAKLDFGAEQIELGGGPAAFAVHTVLEGRIVSHVQPIAPA